MQRVNENNAINRLGDFHHSGKIGFTYCANLVRMIANDVQTIEKMQQIRQFLLNNIYTNAKNPHLQRWCELSVQNFVRNLGRNSSYNNATNSGRNPEPLEQL